MSKRVRGPVRPHRRPGARPPSERGAARRREPVEARPSELELATEIAEDVVEERPAEVKALPERIVRRPATRLHHKIKAGSILAARAATEYVYVAQDLRRIVVVSTALIALIFVLWLLIVVMRVIELPFY